MDNTRKDDEEERDREETPVDPPQSVTAPSAQHLRGVTEDDPRERGDVLDDDVTDE